jgi:hypothetical protein
MSTTSRNKVSPHRIPRRIKSAVLFSPVSRESYPLNHHVIAAAADSRMMFTKVMNAPVFK